MIVEWFILPNICLSNHNIFISLTGAAKYCLCCRKWSGSVFLINSIPCVGYTRSVCQLTGGVKHVVNISLSDHHQPPGLRDAEQPRDHWVLININNKHDTGSPAWSRPPPTPCRTLTNTSLPVRDRNITYWQTLGSGQLGLDNMIRIAL